MKRVNERAQNHPVTQSHKIQIHRYSVRFEFTNLLNKIDRGFFSWGETTEMKEIMQLRDKRPETIQVLERSQVRDDKKEIRRKYPQNYMCPITTKTRSSEDVRDFLHGAHGLGEVTTNCKFLTVSLNNQQKHRMTLKVRKVSVNLGRNVNGLLFILDVQHGGERSALCSDKPNDRTHGKRKEGHRKNNEEGLTCFYVGSK